MIEIARYRAEDKEAWNNFIDIARQATFLFNRNYMDYHASRFNDCSFVVKQKKRIIAVFPANRVGEILYSHQGLTYGGLLTSKTIGVERVAQILDELSIYLKRIGVNRIIYKAIPWIYHTIPSQEDLYILTNQYNVKLLSRNISSAFPLIGRQYFSQSRRWRLRKAKTNAIFVDESNDLSTFWKILSDNLKSRFGATPVHSLEEIERLKNAFPKLIKLYMAVETDSGQALGGTIIFETQQVIHTQYISATEKGKEVGAIDLIFDKLINSVYKDRGGYFDFGTSATNGGKDLNKGLINQKESYGGRAVCYDIYDWKL